MPAPSFNPRTLRVFRSDGSGGLEKHCSGCDKWLPAVREFFSSAPHGKTLGLSSQCLACISEKNRDRKSRARPGAKRGRPRKNQ